MIEHSDGRLARYADDLIPGTTYDLGTHTVSTEEIVSFARQWDPQGFHLDEEVARTGHFGGLIASGLHSMAILQRLTVLGLLQDLAVIAGRSVDDVQMTSPVRPGMTLRGRVRIDAVEHRGPERALVRQFSSLLHEDTPVLSFRGTMYVHRRPTVATDGD